MNPVRLILIALSLPTVPAELREGSEGLGDKIALLTTLTNLCGSLRLPNLVRFFSGNYADNLKSFALYTGNSSHERAWRMCQSPAHIVEHDCSCAAFGRWTRRRDSDFPVTDYDALPSDPGFAACRLRQLCPTIRRQLSLLKEEAATAAKSEQPINFWFLVAVGSLVVNGVAVLALLAWLLHRCFFSIDLRLRISNSLQLHQSFAVHGSA